MAELQSIIAFHGRHFVRHLRICNPICVKLLQGMSGVIPSTIKNDVSISNRFHEVHKRGTHTHRQTDRQTHTHTHDDSTRQFVAFRLKNWSDFKNVRRGEGDRGSSCAIDLRAAMSDGWTVKEARERRRAAQINMFTGHSGRNGEASDVWPAGVYAALLCAVAGRRVVYYPHHSH